MSYLDWKPGDKLVCIDNKGQVHNLSIGTVYTISKIGTDHGEIYVGLVEKPMDSSSGIDWLVCRFRPVTKCTTSISIFTQMLNPSKVDA